MIIGFINMNIIDRINYILENYGDIESIVKTCMKLLCLFASHSLNIAEKVFSYLVMYCLYRYLITLHYFP